MIQIKLAGEKELPSIMEIENTLFSVPWSEQGFLTEMCGRDGFVAVAMEEEKVLGFAVLHRFGDEAELFNIAVAPENQRRGIGQMLMEWLGYTAMSQNIGRVFLEVRISNEPAKKLYEKNGFRPVGLRKGYYDAPKEDAVLMAKDIGK